VLPKVRRLSRRTLDYPIKGEIYSAERLEEYAEFLARQLQTSKNPKVTHALLPRMRENGKKLLQAYRMLAEAVHRKDSLPPAAEWLTDNFHIVEEQLREIEEDLPPKYYKELPKITLGQLAGYPRVYAIALALIAHTDSQLELDTIRRFVLSYQKVTPLTIGELWALAITLRLVLVENLRRVAVRIVEDHERRNLANEFADQLFEVAGNEKRFKNLIKKMPFDRTLEATDDSALISQMTKRLRDQEPELWPALEQLEKYLTQQKSSVEQVVHISHQQQAASQVTVANVITSMRLLSSVNWQKFFESVSLVDRVLEEDPIYPKMDFPTRDRYRHVIEAVFKKTGNSETEVARFVVQTASSSRSPQAIDARPGHVGYYLIGGGTDVLKKKFGYRTKHKISSFSLSHPNFVYFGLFLISFVTTMSVPFYFSQARSGLFFVLCLLITLPCSELAMNIVNLILSHTLRPERLPKLDLSLKIPQEGRTMVVVPCLLAGFDVIDELIQKLEIHYLGNSDEQLYFSLLTDFCDSSTETEAEDEKYVRAVQAGIQKLNRKYASVGNERFLLFHRYRQWNAAENAWIGWERKRGKLHEFNQLLRGQGPTSFVIAPTDLNFLKSIRYVITLDADTQLPRDCAKKLIGTVMHPLNQAYFDKDSGRVTEGYGILQPRVGISLESSGKSFFAKLYSGYTGIDPYTTAVSDAYQDLFGEGIFVGKGLYDVDAFEQSMAGRVSENTILSHDLFESSYARAALVTDVEVIDDYPQSYRTFFTRQHRWIRGDWQIASWILPFVPNAQRKWVHNQLSAISKWRIFDNLRRSLVAPFFFLFLVTTLTFLPKACLPWLVYGLVIIFFPSVMPALISWVRSLFQKRSNFLASKTMLNLLQGVFYFALLAHQAWVPVDAIFRTLYRKLVSKKKLLEWSTAAQVEKDHGKQKKPFWQTSWPVEIFIVVWAALLFTLRSPSLILATVIGIIWMAYPLLASVISRRRTRKEQVLTDEDQLLLRQIARRTWNYFETFVGAGDNWLPPDNHQEYPKPLTAHRTSPTNMGLYILSLSSAWDFGYISSSHFIHRLHLTLASLQKLEQHEGHYYNWYDTESLQPLHPKYVSTVDSGNLAGYFVTVRQACLELAQRRFLDRRAFRGLQDIVSVIRTELSQSEDFIQRRSTMAELLKSAPIRTAPASVHMGIELLRTSLHSLEKVKEDLNFLKLESPQAQIANLLSWTEKGIEQGRSLLREFDLLMPWYNPSFLQLGEQLQKASSSLYEQYQKCVRSFNENIRYAGLVQFYESFMEQILEASKILAQNSELSGQLFLFSKELTRAGDSVAQLLKAAEAAAQFLDEKFKQMNFKFLLVESRGVFTIGYNVTDGRFDSGLYDLLASESRLASFVAIAKGDVQQEHWFRLGRQLVPIAGGRALISWTASMFEYLMPLLVMRDYENTLINETVHTVVRRQISYGKENHVPWGVSEAGYNARDLQLNYQYGPFGVPGLGLKRGLNHDLVISPYSTVLAAMVSPLLALKNMKRFIRDQLLTTYGFYEAIDYTVDRLPENQKFVVIKSFMAHHQGMSLVAINNIIHNNIIQKRFHDDPRIRATRLLLQERVPQGVIPTLPKAAEMELEDESPATANPFVRRYTNPNSSVPRVQLLSNRTYSLMISTAGGGYSRCDGLGVTRWKEDPTRDNWGNFIFVRDVKQKAIWSTTYQPLNETPSEYEVTFGEEKVDFKRRDGDLSTYTQIIVAPEDNVEIRHVTLTNHSDEPRVVELTSYLEPVLYRPTSDSDHQAFSKLFIQTEYLLSKSALLAKRRKRSAKDRELWGLHVVVADTDLLSDVQYETDRAKFLGRGQSLQRAAALKEDALLSNSSGATLDPILSLRVKVRVPAHGKIQVAFTTGLVFTREEALELADRYHDIHSFERESKLAWTKSQVDMRHLNVDTETAHLYQRIAERLLYAEPSLRPPAHQRAQNTDTQSKLWASGISGDLPIFVVRIDDQKEIANVRKILRCHEYLRMKGLIYDLVILNDQGTTYLQNLQDELNWQIRSTGLQAWLNKPGGIFILRRDTTTERDLANIQSVARVSVTADQPLKEQINRKYLEEKYPADLTLPLRNVMDKVLPARAEKKTVKANLPALEFFNGLGGFSADGSEYIIQLSAGKSTPAPWINVIGNAHEFGFQVSESGSGFTWALNSQAFRLTPWSNDPVCDPSGEIIYLRDDETGEVWTPTPHPIRSQSTYTIRHGQGYSIFEVSENEIDHSLKLFVPKDEKIKVSLLTLKNRSSRTRKISITSLTEWVLGTQRDKTSAYLICDADAASGALFARNPYDNEFSNRFAFVNISSTDRTFTCSRREFLGRNGSYELPAALLRDGLSEKRSGGPDPCAVLQTSVELEPGEEYEMTVLLGQCDNVEAMRTLSKRYRDIATAKAALNEVMQSWNKLTNKIQVKTPDPALDVMMNKWLFYQTLSCRYWSRSAFYQSGGAFGFRDQLQDCMAFVYSAPEIAREHIVRASARQFPEGDVQHWWHPPTGRGVRTRMSDDLLWLPYVVSFYIRVTGDRSILDEVTPFLEGDRVSPDQEDLYSQPRVSNESATVREHCLRTINYSLAVGAHDLPLMGTGDWNDGMNHVGFQGKGESIWLGWFLYRVLGDFQPFCEEAARETYKAHQQKLKLALEKDGWDGDWYKRAYFDDGTPLGSASNDECRIDSLSQSWAVLSRAGDIDRARHAMAKVSEMLVHTKSKIILLFTPAFDKTTQDPGYIKGYVPGVRENGGQYTHAATWMIMAYAELGDGNRAYELFNMLNPINHSRSEAEYNKYRIEPYVMAGDVYAGHGHEGRGGWSWYTGSASWYYRAALESILGFYLQGNRLSIKPCIPNEWKSYEISYTYGKSRYDIKVQNPRNLSSGKVSMEMDGKQSWENEITLIDDGKNHSVLLTLQN
jgi:cyclic beta-1,2-glucan synthetase